MSTRIRIQIEFAHPPLHLVPRTPLGILATDHASKGARNVHLSLPCVTNLYFIVRVMAESVQKSKKNAKSNVDSFIWTGKRENLETRLSS